jgi:hypothetical protein
MHGDLPPVLQHNLQFFSTFVSNLLCEDFLRLILLQSLEFEDSPRRNKKFHPLEFRKTLSLALRSELPFSITRLSYE